MKIYGDRLEGSLRKGLGRLYILSGDEPLLLQEAGEQVREAAKAAGFTERELLHTDGNFDWKALSQKVNSGSLFAERRILEVRINTGKPDAQKAAFLADAAEQLDDDILLLVVMPRVDAKTQRVKWFQRLEAKGLFVQIWPIEAKSLPGWLTRRFEKAGLRPSKEAVRMMAQRLEGNLLAAVQEIERLRLVAEGGEVTAEMVEGSVADSTRYDVFKLIDAAVDGRPARVARMVRGLQSEGVQVLYLTNMLARELRGLEKMACDLAEGQRVSAVMARARVWKARAPLVQKCLERTSVTELRQHQLALGRIDRMAKGVLPGDPWQEAATTLLALAGAAILPS